MLQLLIDELQRIRDAARRASQLPSVLDGDGTLQKALRAFAATDYEKSEAYAAEFALARAKVERLQNELSILADAEVQAQEALEQLQIKVNLDHVPDTAPVPLASGPSEQAMLPQPIPLTPSAPTPTPMAPPLMAPPPMAPPPPAAPGGAAKPPPPLGGPAKKVPTKPAIHPDVKMKV